MPLSSKTPRRPAKYCSLSLLVLLILISGALAGLQGPPPKHQLQINLFGSPCDCRGGTQRNVPRSHTQHSDCGDKMAYLAMTESLAKTGYTQSWVCVSKPQVKPSGASLGPCPQECTTFHASMHSSCYSEASQCITQGRTYYTAILNTNQRAVAPGHIPAAIYSSPYMSAPCEGTVGKSVCWNLTAPIHMSDGGGPQDQTRQQMLEERWRELFDLPPIEYHPLLKPHPRGVTLDSQTLSILEATHRALNVSNPDLAQDCWLCMSLGTSFPLAVPVQNSSFVLQDTSNCSLSRPFPVQMSTPFNATCISSEFNDTLAIQVGFGQGPLCDNITKVEPTQRCAPQGHVLVCGSHAYSVLPANWTGVCALAILLPDIDIIPGDQPVPIPAMDSWPARSKRAVQVVPILVGLGISAAMGTGAAGLGGLP